MERIIVGLSGGVDSAVAAAILLRRGYEVHGVTLKLWKFPQGQTAVDPVSPGTIATALEIPLLELDLAEKFYTDIVQPFVAAYAEGVTPNPCVICNPTLKFQALLEVADSLQARWIATGHYARIIHQPESSHLLRGSARQKDQSYALYRLNQLHLQRLRLPLGEMESKSQVRELARQWNLPGAEKIDSQDLCFMGGGDYRPLIHQVNPDRIKPGLFVDEEGSTLGEHQGLAFYTIGQRGGLRIASSQRLYVLRMDTQENRIVVGPRSSLDQSGCHIKSVTFTAGHSPGKSFTVMGRFRYRSPDVPMVVTLINENTAWVRFQTPQQLIAPGQSMVFYQDDEVLGGGIITNETIQTGP